MSTLVDRIERYIKRQIRESERQAIEIRRRDLAEIFNCAPSQISYALETRFTQERGYLVETRRGGGGFIRVVRLPLSDQEEDFWRRVNQRLGEWIDQKAAEDLIEGLLEQDLINEREAALLSGAIRRDAIAVELPLRDVLRARILRSMLAALLTTKRGRRR